MNQLIIKDNIREIKKSIIYLTALNDHDALIMANNDLIYYEFLLSGFFLQDPKNIQLFPV